MYNMVMDGGVPENLNPNETARFALRKARRQAAKVAEEEFGRLGFADFDTSAPESPLEKLQRERRKESGLALPGQNLNRKRS